MVEISIVHTPYFVERSGGSGEYQVNGHGGREENDE